MKILSSEKIPKSNGHYSHAIIHNGLIYISGQLPIDPDTGKMPESVERQTRMVLEKIDLILNESGSSRDRLIQLRVYITDIKLWDRVNAEYAAFMGNHKPVRCIVPVPELHFGAKVEIEATAALNT